MVFGKQKIATLVAEFLGTGALTLLILSVQRSTIGVPFFVAAAAGLSIALMIMAVGKTSGGYFNPALTIGFWTARKIETVTAVLYILVQFAGAFAAGALYAYFVKNKLQDVGGKFDWHILIAEATGTAIFAFGVASAVYQKLAQAALASFAGLALMIGSIAASSAAIGLLNPAVALGIKAWVLGTYVLGPIIGAVVGVQLYALLFAEPATAAASSSVAQASTGKKPVAKKKTSKKK